MTGRRRPRQPLAPRNYPVCTTCGKYGYPSRRTARRVARQIHPGILMRLYACGPWIHMTQQSTAVVTAWRERERGIR